MLIAFDIGGTKIAAGLFEQGVMLDRRQLSMAYDEEGFSRLLAQLTSGWEKPQQLAVAATGYVHRGRICSVNRDIIPFWNRFPLQRLMQQKFNSPVTLINDAQAAAWGEYQARKQLGSDSCPADLLFITLSTGVGGGLVLNHQLRTGHSGLAGHMGHAASRLPASDQSLLCGCGRQGCLETVASGTALARQASKAYRYPVSPAELFVLARTEHTAASILNNAAAAVAEAVAGLHMSLDLEEVVIGGSVGLADSMLSRIQTNLQSFKLPASPRLSRAMLAGDAGLIGAAGWACR